MSEKNEWKPIESAPKDGTEIIVFHPQAGVCAAFCPGDGFAWHCMDGMNTGIGKKSGQSIPIMTSFVEPPTHWMPLPAEPCLTCNGHGMVGGLTPHSGYDAEPCPDCTPAPSAPGDAQDERQAFEAWAEDQGFVLDCDFFEVRGQYYDQDDTQLAYDIWRAARASAPAAGDALAIDLDRVLSIADEHAEESREDGRRVLDRGGLLALARDVLRVAEAPNAASDALDKTRLPAKMPKHESDGSDYPSADSYQEGYAEGWNDAIDAALAAQVPHKGDAA